MQQIDQLTTQIKVKVTQKIYICNKILPTLCVFFNLLTTAGEISHPNLHTVYQRHTSCIFAHMTNTNYVLKLKAL